MRLLLVFNPRSAGGRHRDLQQRVRRLLVAGGASPEVLETVGPGSVIRQLSGLALDGIDAVVAVGGDGTVFDVANGLLSHPGPKIPALGVIPVGTGNAFCRDIGLRPGDWEHAAQVILADRRRWIDTGEVATATDRFGFVNVVGAGFAARAARTAARLKFLRRSAYTVATLFETARLQPFRLTLEVDGRMVERENLLVEISNSRYTGTHFLIAPQADIADGWLDVTLVAPMSRARLLRLFPTVYTGEHLRYPEVETFRARTVRWLAPEGMELTPDGEFRGITPAEFRCLPGRLEVIGAAG